MKQIHTDFNVQSTLSHKTLTDALSQTRGRTDTISLNTSLRCTENTTRAVTHDGVALNQRFQAQRRVLFVCDIATVCCFTSYLSQRAVQYHSCQMNRLYEKCTHWRMVWTSIVCLLLFAYSLPLSWNWKPMNKKEIKKLFFNLTLKNFISLCSQNKIPWIVVTLRIMSS